MPFAAPSMMDDEKLKAEEKNGNTGVNVSGTSNTFSTGVPGQEGQGGGKQTHGSGDKFANIQSYLDANKQQGDQMGQKVASGVESNAQLAQSKIGSYEAAAPKVQAYDPNQAYQKLGGLSDQEKSQYNEAKSGYKGPQTQDQVAGYSEAQAASNKAAEEAKQAGTQQGQAQLLKQTYARPDYSAGQNALDQTIVGSSSVAKQGFEDLNKKYSGLNDLFGKAATNVGNQINSNIKTALSNQQAIAKGESDQWNNLINPIQSRVDEYNKYQPGMIDQILNEAKTGALTNDSLNLLGLNEDQKTYGLDVSSYINPDRTAAGLNNLATQDERNKYAALQALIGDPTRAQITADGKAITPISFDSAKFNREVAMKEKEANAALKPLQDQLAHLQSWVPPAPGQYGGDMDLPGRPSGDTVAAINQNMADIAATQAAIQNLIDQYQINAKVSSKSGSRIGGTTTNVKDTGKPKDLGLGRMK
jgi:hypothetical protein